MVLTEVCWWNATGAVAYADPLSPRQRSAAESSHQAAESGAIAAVAGLVGFGANPAELRREQERRRWYRKELLDPESLPSLMLSRNVLNDKKIRKITTSNVSQGAQR